MEWIALANPSRFLALAERLLPWLAAATALAFAAGLYAAFFVAPEDYQQGATVRIMFIHVPGAWLGMLGWACLGNIVGGVGLVTVLRLIQVGGDVVTEAGEVPRRRGRRGSRR